MKKKPFLLIVLSIAFSYGFYVVKDLSASTFNLIPPSHALSFSTTTTWQEFNLPYHSFVINQEKSAWIESITIKAKKAITIGRFILHWDGEPLEKISASLYQKRHDKDALIPIQTNLICDGRWDKNHQELVFELNKKVVSLNTFYLVLSFPAYLEEKLKKGTFSLKKLNEPLSPSLIINKSFFICGASGRSSPHP